MRPEIKALLRKDFLSFLHKAFVTIEPSVEFRPNWHHLAIVHALTEVTNGSCRRLMINQPPRSLKSICASVAYPAWLLGRDPGLDILCVSYGSDLARRTSTGSSGQSSIATGTARSFPMCHGGGRPIPNI